MMLNFEGDFEGVTCVDNFQQIFLNISDNLQLSFFILVKI